MPQDYEDSFDWDDAIGGGGLLAEYVGTITSAKFGIDTEYRDDTVRFIPTIVVESHDDPDSTVEPGDEFTEGYNVGRTSTWEASTDGNHVARVDGNRVRFNNNSGYGEFVSRAIPGKDYSMKGAEELAKVLRERGPATKADIWEGLTFRFVREERSFKNDDGEKVTYERVLPAEYVGESSGKVDAPKQGAEPEPAAESNGDSPTRDELVELARGHDSYSSFLAAVLPKYPGVESGPLAGDLLDEDGIYAEAQT